MFTITVGVVIKAEYQTIPGRISILLIQTLKSLVASLRKPSLALAARKISVLTLDKRLTFSLLLLRLGQ
jgi:hypothetical protein